jgi:hypothetical protein
VSFPIRRRTMLEISLDQVSPKCRCQEVGNSAMSGTLPYQITRPIPGKLYICEVGRLPITGRLAGPFDTEAEAQAAAGAIEAEHTCYQAQTEVWICPVPEPETDPIPPLLLSPAGSPHPVTS